MPAIHIRNVPESLISALRERAGAHGRSLEQEVLAILDDVTAQPSSELVTVRTSEQATWRREDMYGDEGR